MGIIDDIVADRAQLRHEMRGDPDSTPGNIDGPASPVRETVALMKGWRTHKWYDKSGVAELVQFSKVHMVVSYKTAWPEFKAMRQPLIEWAEGVDVPRANGEGGGPRGARSCRRP